MNALVQLAGVLALTTQLELATPEPRAEFVMHDCVPRRMAFSPDAEKLAIAVAQYEAETVVGTILSLLKAGGSHGWHSWQLTVLETKTGKKLAEVDLERTIGDHVCAMCFSPDGRFLAVGTAGRHRDDFVSVWDLSGPKPIEKASYQWRREQDGLVLVSIAFSADGKSLVAVGGATRVWDLTTNKDKPVVFRHEKEQMWSAALSPDGKRLVTIALNPLGFFRVFFPGALEEPGTLDGAIRTWDVATGKETRAVDVGEFAAFKPEFADEGNALTYLTVVPLVVMRDEKKCICRLRKWTVDGDAAPPVAVEDREIDFTDFGLLMSWNTDPFSIQPGKIEVVDARNGEVVVRDIVAGKQLARFNPGHGKGATLHLRSPDGKTLATGSTESDRVRLWDVAELLKQEREE